MFGKMLTTDNQFHLKHKLHFEHIGNKLQGNKYHLMEQKEDH
jgi:hypothetical protein